MADPLTPDQEAAVEAAMREAGALAMASYIPGAATSAHSWSKSGGSPVCAADLAVDALLRERLGAILPDAGWLSEETADNADRLTQRRLWVVDPIDGTRDYVHGRPGWCISVALIADGAAAYGALFAPVAGDFWQARRGAGARRNGAAINASRRSILPGARIPARGPVPSGDDLTHVPCPNSIALRMAMVAADEADLVTSIRWGAEWDIAAAALIAAEAGAWVSDVCGQPLSYNRPDARIFGVMAAAPALIPELHIRLAPHIEKAQKP